jgi:DNA-binding Lrp family transcriptional regulator
MEIGLQADDTAISGTTKISERERQLIAAVEFNLESSVESLARTLKMPSSAVSYSLKKLVDNEILRPRCFVNSYKLGLEDVGFFFNLVEQSPTARTKLIKKFREHESIAYFGSLLGDYQFIAVILSHGIQHAAKLVRELTESSGDIVTEKKIVPRIRAERFVRKYLSPKHASKTIFQLYSDGVPFDADEIDQKILLTLGNTPFESLRHISRVSGLPFATVDRRVKGLRKAGVIQGFFYDLNTTKLGIQSFRVLIEVKGLSCPVREMVLKTCRNHPAVTYLIETLGSWDFELGVETVDARVVSRVVEELYGATERRIGSSQVLMELEDFMCRYYPGKLGVGAHRS